ncbi:MAG: hypothetical protein Q9160_004381 [Pyrenula sp. 1 TL-2023]
MVALNFTILGLVVGVVSLFGIAGTLWHRKYRGPKHDRFPPGSLPWNDAFDPGPPPVPRTHTANDLAGCKSICANSWTTETYARRHGLNRLTTLEARAGPNRRLVEVFDINNLFTTIDNDYKKGFGREIGMLLRANNSDWRNIAASAADYLDLYLQSQGDEDVSLIQLIRTTTFRAVLDHFCAAEVILRDDESIVLATETINELWMLSKVQQSTSDKTNLQAKKRVLQDALKRIFPERDVASKAKENPMNIILPSYETMWRVTFHCVTEMLRRIRHDKTLKTIFDNTTREFLNDLDLDARGDGERLPMRHLINESLRLYPPTKRVYRWRQEQMADGRMSEQCALAAADIEAMQRDVGVWRGDAEEWRPMRWMLYKEGPDLPFLPFGSGSMTCPAKGGFGPRMIGVLVSVLFQNLYNIYELRTCDNAEQESLDNLAGPLDSHRDSYRYLFLWKMEAHRCGQA